MPSEFSRRQSLNHFVAGRYRVAWKDPRCRLVRRLYESHRVVQAKLEGRAVRFGYCVAIDHFYLAPTYTACMQRRNEGLPKMQRAATQLINIQTFYSQRAVRLKIIVKYCHFCFEDLVFSKVCLDNFLV